MKKIIITAAAFIIAASFAAGCKTKDKKDPSETSEKVSESSENTSEETEKETSGAESTEETVQNVTAYTVTDVNFRKGPGTDYESLAVIAEGIQVEILGTEDGWCHIRLNGAEGYVFGEYLQEGTGKETAASSEETEPSVTEKEENTEETEPSVTETEESADETDPSESGPSGGNGGILTDSGRFDCPSLPNQSIPYGNDWEDKDEKGLASGVHYYESLYGKYDPYFYIDTDEKILYLTLDEGYEAGYTPKILDTLKEKNVKAVFFLTKQFVDSDPELVRRMIDEGHILGNHTCNHPAGGYPKTVDEKGLDYFTDDLSKLHKMIYDQFGYEMKLFRFPEGEFSEQLLAKTDNLGYTSVFWSYAHYDFNENEQPDPSVTLQRCVSHMAPGAIYLLHAKSSSNTEALGEFIDQARAQGYEFGVFPVGD